MEIKIIKKPNFYKTGGEINIKESHKGLFTQKANRAGMGVQEFASHVLANKQNYSSATIKQAVFAQNAAKWHADGGNLFNDGGNILGGYHTNGTTWQTPGGFHIIGSGGTHEENKNEGVLQGRDSEGAPNLVEENEVVYNDYVFSNRLTVPKRRKGTEKEISDLAWEEKLLKPYEDKTYAEAAKKAYKNVQERPNDPIAKRGFETLLGVLAGSQEKERAKKEHQDAAEEITEMSGQEFAQVKAAEEQQQAMEQTIQEQAIQQQIQDQQIQQQPLSPEEYDIAQQQMAVQQQPQEYAAYGGNLHAMGGDLNNEIPQQQNTQDTQDTIDNQEEEPSFINIEDPEDLSTNKLNSTIEEIIQYAKENKLKDIVKAGRKAKRSSREDKEEFIEDSIDTIKDFIQQQKQQELAKQEQQMQEQQSQEQQSQESQIQTSQQQIAQAQMQNSMSPEQAAQAELNSQMQAQQFAAGGQMSQGDQLAQMQQLATMYSQYLQQNNPKLFEQTNAELQQYLQQAQQSGQISQEDLQMIPIQYYASRAQKDTEFLNQVQQVQGQQYALGGSMSLNNPDGGDIYKGNKIFSGTKKILTTKEKEEAKKQLNKYYRKMGINPIRLQGAAKERYNKDLQAIYNNMSISDNYNFTKDKTLAINSDALSTKTKKYNASTYSNNAWYDALVNRGAKAVELTDDGKVKWNNADGLTIVDSSAEDFYSNPANFNENNGIYNYNDGSNGYKSKNFTSPEEFQQYYRTAITDRFKTLKGDKYSNEKLPNYYLNASELRSWVNDLESSNDPKAKELALALKANWGDKNTSWSNDATWNLKNKYTKDGTVTESQSYLDIPDVKENGLQTDALPGIEHIPYLEAIKTDPTANRYFYKDIKGQQHFITKPTNTSFTISDTPIQSKVEDINYNDYEVKGFNQKRKLYKTPDGRVLDVTGMSDINNGKWKDIDNIVMPDDTSNLGEGITGESSWVDTDEAGNGVDFPLPSKWPWIAGIGLQTGATLYNALTPVDYSNADATINAAKEAGNFQPIGFRPIGDYLTYKPLDRDYEGTKIRSAMAAERRALANLSGGNRGTATANIIASDNNLITQLGDVDRESAEYNRNDEIKRTESNRGTNQFNSEGFLKADMANQEAMSRASQARLEGLIKGYAMRQAADDAKANAINAGISGIAENLFGLYQQNYNNALIKYGMDTGTYGTANYNWKKNPNAQGGQLRTRRRRGLTF